MNKEFLKKVFSRFSTWLNIVAGLMAASMAFIPDLGLSGPQTAMVSLVFAVVIKGSQMIPQGKKND
jgi:hypothetical protein